ncbi:hypothetical protein ACE6H2_015315 [Prunus campanulata]
MGVVNKQSYCAVCEGGVAFDFFRVIILSHANLCKGVCCSRDANACQLSLTRYALGGEDD